MESKLKVLWMTFGGVWVKPLINILKNDVNVDVLMPTSTPSESEVKDGIRYHYVQVAERQLNCEMSKAIADKYLKIIESAKPDLVHIHGTELNLGQIVHYLLDIPVVVSIQGILTECYPASTNGLTKSDMRPFRTLKNIMGRGGLYAMERTWKHGSEAYELDIIKNNRYFICRTQWDKAFVQKHNTQAQIFHGEELLRPAFYNNAGKWSLDKCVSHRIFTTAGFNPIKGLHHAIRVLAEIKKQWPDVSMVIPGTQMHVFAYRGLKQRVIGEEYVGYCNHLIEQLGVRDNIQFLPRLNDEQMVEQLLQANVFLSATSIDNSPNALGESMMIGVPAVINSVGGVPSIIDDKQNGMLSTLDQLAVNINELFQSCELAKRLSRGAYETALRRHDREATRRQYLDIYQNIITINP